MKAAIVFETPVGAMTLVQDDDAIIGAYFHDQPPPDVLPTQTPLLRRAQDELCEYFAGQRQRFDLPLAPNGTAFQKRCWKALESIPYGETLSYGEEAIRIGNPKACRAVGMANHHNPICVLIPCHRVVGKNGALVGYGGGLDVKKYLLTLERQAKGCR